MSRKIIAILRGVTPADVVDIASALIDSGISTIEVPLNSPQAIDSIERLASRFGQSVLIGAGTVLNVDQVEAVANVGGQIIVSPDCNPDVIMATKRHGMLSYPGVMTPTECFSALRNGADGLKFFPSFLVGTEGLKALSAVLPAKTGIYAVGGVGPENFGDWFAAGVTGFGIGSAIYKPGMDAAQVRIRAVQIVEAYDRVMA